MKQEEKNILEEINLLCKYRLKILDQNTEIILSFDSKDNK